MKDFRTPAAGQVLTGPLFNEPMRVETVRAQGPDAWVVGLVGLQSERFRSVTLTAADLKAVTVLEAGCSFDGDGRLLRLGLQAYALGIAYEFDPYFGVSISGVDPLPHQRCGHATLHLRGSPLRARGERSIAPERWRSGVAAPTA